jgi:CheY-like chemotaxis protein
MTIASGAQDIIVADNDYIVRDILRSVLENEGFTVLPAANGLEAIDYAMRTRASMVILDYKMPKLDGLVTCAEMRRLPGYADVPIAILTAFDDEATRTAAQSAGVTAFFAKPFKPVDLLRGIATLLGRPSVADGAAHGFAEPGALIWKRRHEPTPLFGEPSELSEGRRVLNIYRR